MPNWKKVIVSGSNAVLNNITASGAISASGELYAGLSPWAGSDNSVVVLNNTTGELMYTGSYSSGGNRWTISETDGFPLITPANTSYTTLQFEENQITFNGSNVVISAPTLDQVTDQGNDTTNSAIFLNGQSLNYAVEGGSGNATSGFKSSGGNAYTHVTPQPHADKFAVVGMPMNTQGGTAPQPYPYNYLVLGPNPSSYTVVVDPGGGGPGGGGGGNPDEDHPNDGGGHLIVTGQGIQIQASSSASSIEKDNKARGIYMTPSAFYFINTDASASVSGGLEPISASAKIKFDTGSNSIKFFAGSTNEELKEVMHISKSGDNPRVGIGTSNPLTNFDFKDVSDSRNGTKMVLRSSRLTKGGNAGDEAGKINFVIDSSSYGDIETSGSVAKILGSVLNINSEGAGGKLSFEVADSSDPKNDTTEVFRLQKNPFGTLDLTYTVGVFEGSVNLNGSNSSLYAGKDVEAAGNIFTTTGYVKADSLRIGTNINPGNDSAIIQGDLILNNDFTSSGDISSSGDLTANNGSFSGDLTVEGDIIAQNYIVSSSVTYMTQSFSSGSTIFGDTLDDTHQFTGSILYTGSLDINGMTYPTTDGEDGQVLLTDGDGVLTFGDVKVYAQVKNISGVTLAKGTPVHATASASPPAGNISEVIAASASLAATMPATFILDEELADDAEGRAILSGFINGIDTSAFSEGDVVYVGPDGGYTTTKPTGTNLIQNLGIITKVDASNGAGYIYGSGRSNDVPNITEGYAWVGNSSGVATATATSSFIAAGTISSSAQISNLGFVDTTGTPANNQLAVFTDADTIEGDSDLTWDGSTFTINGTGSVDLLQVDDKLQGNGSGFQFFAFNEDTVKVKFANWYSSNDRQYGMGQLWFETWFAAIDNGALRDNRRIGFYLEEPNSGSLDADGGSGGHPTNSRFYVDINGAYLSGSFQASGDITGSALQLGNLGAENEILIVGANTEVTSSNLLAIDTVNERVGIGTSTPQVKLDLVGESSGEAQIRVAQHDNTSDGPDIRFFKSHGTAAASSSVANNDYIGAVNAFAYDGSTYIQSGFFGFQADGTDGDSKFGLRTRVDGTLTDRITVDAAGDVNIAGELSANGATFTGNLIVTGSQLITDDITSDGTIRARVKSFDIPHPTRKNKRLVYGALEGPEHGIYCRGESKELKVLLPPEWRAMVDKKGITVQITPIGEWQPLYFKRLHSNWLYFGCGDDRENVHFYWEIKGERTDVPSLETVQ